MCNPLGCQQPEDRNTGQQENGFVQLVAGCTLADLRHDRRQSLHYLCLGYIEPLHILFRMNERDCAAAGAAAARDARRTFFEENCYGVFALTAVCHLDAFHTIVGEAPGLLLVANTPNIPACRGTLDIFYLSEILEPAHGNRGKLVSGGDGRGVQQHRTGHTADIWLTGIAHIIAKAQ